MTYDYICKKCKWGFSISMNFTDYKEGNKRVKCPNCLSYSVKRAYISPASIRFVGKGFYSTDNKKGG